MLQSASDQSNTGNSSAPLPWSNCSWSRFLDSRHFQPEDSMYHCRRRHHNELLLPGCCQSIHDYSSYSAMPEKVLMPSWHTATRPFTEPASLRSAHIARREKGGSTALTSQKVETCYTLQTIRYSSNNHPVTGLTVSAFFHSSGTGTVCFVSWLKQTSTEDPLAQSSSSFRDFFFTS